MRRRRRLLLRVVAVALLSVAGFVLYLWLTRPVPGVASWENYRRLRMGMSSSEVEALIGKPHKTLKWEGDFLGRCTKGVWRTKEIALFLIIDFDRGVIHGIASRPGQDGGADCPLDYVHFPSEESFVIDSFPDRIRRWLHW